MKIKRIHDGGERIQPIAEGTCKSSLGVGQNALRKTRGDSIATSPEAWISVRRTFSSYAEMHPIYENWLENFTKTHIFNMR